MSPKEYGDQIWEAYSKAGITYVIPALEYPSQIWSPYSLGDIDKIENVHLSFTRRIAGFDYLNYPKRLIACGLEPLRFRPLRLDLVLMYKLLHGHVDIPFNSFFTFADFNHNRGHSFKLFKPRFKHVARQHFFSLRIIEAWNKLPPSVVDSSSVETFKRNLLLFN